MESERNGIRDLLARWERGGTSLEEERRLRETLGPQQDAGDEADKALHAEQEAPEPAERRAEKMMFAYFSKAAAQHSDKKITLPTEAETDPAEKTVGRIRRLWAYSLSAAAAVAIAVTLSLTLLGTAHNEAEYYCTINGIAINDKEIAMEQFNAAMSLINAGFTIVESSNTDNHIKQLLDYLEPSESEGQNNTER